MKQKQCSNCTYIGPIYKNITVDGDRLKLCKSCAMKYNAKNTKPQPAQRKPIKKFSDKRAKRNAVYLIAKTAFLQESDNQVCPITSAQTTEVHHMNGREGERLLDRTFWLAVSRKGHQWVHSNPEKAREQGWLI